jgi:hypothetical protein
MLLFLFLLSEDIFRNRGPGCDVMEKALISSGASREGSCCLLLQVGRNLIPPPMIVVKASNRCQGMINRAVRSSLFHLMNWKNFERTRGKFEPENKTREVVQGNLLPVKLLLGQECPVQSKRSRVGT